MELRFPRSELMLNYKLWAHSIHTLVYSAIFEFYRDLLSSNHSIGRHFTHTMLAESAMKKIEEKNKCET